MSMTQLRWTCPFCGRKGLLNSQIACSGCHEDRPKDVHFYLADSSGQQGAAAPQAGEKKEMGCGVFFWGFGIALVLLAGVVFYSPIERFFASIFTSPDSIFSQSITVDIVGFRWERVATLAEWTEVTESGYSLPRGATLISTEKVRQEGQTTRVDRGERTVTRRTTTTASDGRPVDREVKYREHVVDDMPVYKDKYTYSIYRWKDIDALKSGGRDRNMYWADDVRLSNSQRYRIGSRKELKYVIFRLPDGRSAEAEAGMDLWNSGKPGNKITVIKNSISGKYTEAPPGKQ